MPHRQGKQHLVIEQVASLERVEILLAAADIGSFVGEGDRQVALAGPQRGQRLGRLGLGEGHRHVGKARLDPGQRLRHQGRRGRRESRQAHPAGAQAGDRGHLFLGGVDRGEDVAGAAGQGGTGLGEPDGAADAVDECGAGTLFQPPHHLGDRWLAVAQRQRGAGERALLGDGTHDAQAGHIDHPAMI